MNDWNFVCPVESELSNLNDLPLIVAELTKYLVLGMGALKYVEELQKKKQSDILRFLLRVRCWEV